MKLGDGRRRIAAKKLGTVSSVPGFLFEGDGAVCHPSREPDALRGILHIGAIDSQKFSSGHPGVSLLSVAAQAVPLDPKGRFSRWGRGCVSLGFATRFTACGCGARFSCFRVRRF